MECQALDEVIGWKVVVARGYRERERKRLYIHLIYVFLHLIFLYFDRRFPTLASLKLIYAFAYTVVHKSSDS